VAPENGKARLPTVERLNGGTASWLEEADGSLCQDGTSVDGQEILLGSGDTFYCIAHTD